MADLKEKLEAASSVRAATMSQSKKAGKMDEYATHLIPVDGVNADEAWDAAKQFEQQALDAEKFEAQRVDEENRTYQFFLKCRCPKHIIGGRNFPPIGVYFKKKPVKVVGDGDWYSAYKPDPNTVWRQDIYCQACLKAGIEGAKLHYEWQDPMKGLWTPERRWVWKVPKDAKRASIEGMTRAFDLPYTAANSWREPHEAKVAAALQGGVKSNG